MNIIQSSIKFAGLLSYNNNPMMIVLHHAESSKCTVADVHSWHLNNGWSGIGYHYFVRKDGTIYTGRPESAVGSHCPGVNAKSIGICAEGNYMIEEMPIAQMKAIIELVTSLMAKYKIPRTQIKGHNQVPYPTNCPGTKYPMGKIVEASGFKVADVTPVQVKIATADDGIINMPDKGPLVTDVQVKLISLGYKLGVADGIFGGLTKTAVESFQRIMKLSIDGQVGPKTLSVLNEVSKKPLLKVGCDYNFAVMFVQAKLGASTDGDFGPSTLAAVRAFQAKKGLSTDGIVGSVTWAKIIG